MPQWPMPMAGRPRGARRGRGRLRLGVIMSIPRAPRAASHLPAPSATARAPRISIVQSIITKCTHYYSHSHRTGSWRVCHDLITTGIAGMSHALGLAHDSHAAHTGSILLTRVNTPTSRSIRARQIEACTEHIHNRGSDVWGAAHHTGGRPHPRDPPVTTHSTHSVDVHGHDTE